MALFSVSLNRRRPDLEIVDVIVISLLTVHFGW